MLEESASPGVKGLKPVIVALMGRASSASLTVQKGKRNENSHSRKRGSPYVLPGAPLPVRGAPKYFQSGIGPSTTRASSLRGVAFDADGRKESWLVEEIHMVVDRQMGDGPGALQAIHPGSQAADWEGDAIEVAPV
jgi:hypothetical protein